MIPQELIDRTKTNLERLANAMPRKFTDSKIENRFYFHLTKHRSIVGIAINAFPDKYTYTHVNEDPQQEFSNSVGRIAWEAFGKRIFLEYNFVPIRYDSPIVEREIEFRYDGKMLASKTELSAQLEALNILIEQEIK